MNCSIAIYHIRVEIVLELCEYESDRFHLAHQLPLKEPKNITQKWDPRRGAKYSPRVGESKKMDGNDETYPSSPSTAQDWTMARSRKLHDHVVVGL